MRIFKIKNESNIYQSVFPNMDDNEILDFMTFDCVKKNKDWTQIEWYVFNTQNIVGDFFSLGSSGALVFNEKVFYSDLYSLLEMSGQILKIKLNGFNLYVLNVLECINLLNNKKTKRDLYEDGSQGRILEYYFFKNRFTESSLFKIPETRKGEILTYSEIKDSEDEFMFLYKKLGFKGLVFEELFNDNFTSKPDRSDIPPT